MEHADVAVATRVGPKGAFDVDLPLDTATLNERLFDIRLWLIARHIPHQARILWEPYHRRIRVSFPGAGDAGAFSARFCRPLHWRAGQRQRVRALLQGDRLRCAGSLTHLFELRGL